MDDFQKKITANNCDCGGKIIPNGVGYSCPAVYYFKCDKCGYSFDETDPEDGIKVLTFEESVKKRPHLYLEHEDKKIRDLAKKFLESS